MATKHAAEAPSRAIKLCGTEAAEPASRRLKAGPLEAELENGQLRYVAFGGIEVLRGVAFLVRDENWGTYTPKIDEIRIEESPDHFSVSYRAVCVDARQRLVYEAKISGESSGALTFAAVATPETDVITNRTGFVVLHPASLAGRPVRVTHVDGRETAACFPERISPSQPIFDIRALAHEVAPDLWATCRMEGDAFEMEDQRNWGDASYKTYVRPLSLPWGYRLAKGSRHEQSIRLSFDGPSRIAARGAAPEAIVSLSGDLALRMPEIGVAVPSEEAGFALDRRALLQTLRPRFLVGTVDGRDGGGLAQLGAYRLIAESARAAVVLEAVIPDEKGAEASLAPIASAVREAQLKLDAIVVSTAADLKSWQPGAQRPEKPTVEEICAAARKLFPDVRLGGGMLSTFTELNRKRPKAELVDYVTHTTCSIVHAADDRSVMETLETLPAIIASTRAMIGGKAYRIGPSAIAARDNPYGRGVADNPSNERVCLTNKDPRQRGLFNAAWTLGYLAACANGGLEAVAMGAATGPFGFIWRRGAAAQPYFDSIGGALVYPAFHVMAGLAAGFGRPLVATTSPRRVGALAWREESGIVLWLANLSAEPLDLRVQGVTPSKRRISVLDAQTFEQAIRNSHALDEVVRPFEGETIKLDAYAVARID